MSVLVLILLLLWSDFPFPDSEVDKAKCWYFCCISQHDGVMAQACSPIIWEAEAGR